MNNTKNISTEPESGIGISGIQSTLNNTGGPRSRVRTEKVCVNIFTEMGHSDTSEIFHLEIPADVIDIEQWLLGISHQLNWPDLEEATQHIVLPKNRLVVLSANEKQPPLSQLPIDILRNAMILSKCSGSFYNPDSVMILTRNRLNRCVELIKINLENYYAVD